MKIDQIFKNNQEWVQKKLSVDNDYFSNMSKGQNPGLLYIGCSDSRVAAEEIMGVFTWRGLCSQEYCQYGY